MTMLIAGHETTASALTWCVFELAQNPGLLAELREELDAALPDGKAPSAREQLVTARLSAPRWLPKPRSSTGRCATAARRSGPTRPRA